MNETEERRRELLRQTRKLYDERERMPAVHPRYGSVYHVLYEESESERQGNSFWLRLAVSVLLFICFVYMEQNNTAFSSISCNGIVKEIEKDGAAEQLMEVWKKL